MKGKVPDDSCDPTMIAAHYQKGDNKPASFLDPVRKSKLLRDVDNFVMSLPLGDAPRDVKIEEAVANKLFQAEADRQAAQRKTKEWYVCLNSSIL